MSWNQRFAGLWAGAADGAPCGWGRALAGQFVCRGVQGGKERSGQEQGGCAAAPPAGARKPTSIYVSLGTCTRRARCTAASGRGLQQARLAVATRHAQALQQAMTGGKGQLATHAGRRYTSSSRRRGSSTISCTTSGGDACTDLQNALPWQAGRSTSKQANKQTNKQASKHASKAKQPASRLCPSSSP